MRSQKVTRTFEGLPAEHPRTLTPDCAELPGGPRGRMAAGGPPSPTTWGVTAEAPGEVRSQPPTVGHDLIASGESSLCLSVCRGHPCQGPPGALPSPRERWDPGL